MKLFETLQTNWLFLGFSPNLRPFNRQQLKLLFGGAIVVISLGLYPFYKRLSIREYIDSVYMISGAIVIFIASTSNIVQMAEIFRFVDEFEKAIDMSEWIKVWTHAKLKIAILIIVMDLLLFCLGMKFPTSKILYEKSNRLAEKVCDVFFFVVGKLTPVVYVWPKFIYCCFQYFTSDLAFELPIPMWWEFLFSIPFKVLKFRFHCNKRICLLFSLSSQSSILQGSLLTGLLRLVIWLLLHWKWYWCLIHFDIWHVFQRLPSDRLSMHSQWEMIWLTTYTWSIWPSMDLK